MPAPRARSVRRRRPRRRRRRRRPGSPSSRVSDALAFRGGQPAGPSIAEEHKVERPVDVDAQPPSPAKVDDRHARDLVEPARQHVVARQIREAGEGVAGASDGHDVGRVAVVRERRRSIRRGGRDERTTVGRAQERDRARAQDDEPARPDVVEQAPEPSAEGRVVRGAGEHPGARGARSEEPGTMPFREAGPGVGDGTDEPSSVGPRLRVEDRDRHVGQGRCIHRRIVRCGR